MKTTPDTRKTKLLIFNGKIMRDIWFIAHFMFWILLIECGYILF